MNIFDVIIVQPIFNVLLLIYGLLPGHDFGVSIIIFTILVRLALWPLIKKQLHQTKLMRQIQPELKKLKARARGDRQAEAKLMMELYRERGIKPFSSIGILLIQLPIFIALFQVITIITTHPDQVAKHVYGSVKEIDAVSGLIRDPHIKESIFGLFDLTQTAFQDGQIHVSLIVLALVAALFQFIQTKQLMPQTESKKKLRDILRASSAGEKVDQSEMTAIVSNRMAVFMPILLLVFALYLPGAVVLYYAASSIVAVMQQHVILGKDEQEMITLADENMTVTQPVRTKKNKKTKKAKLATGGKNRKRR